MVVDGEVFLRYDCVRCVRLSGLNLKAVCVIVVIVGFASSK